MSAVLKFFVGVVLGGIGINIIKPPIILVVIFIIMGIIFQVVYTHRLNAFLRGEDPVKYGARSLKQLKTIMPIPLIVTVLNIIAGAFLYATLIAILEAFHLIKRF
ncbi:MAG: hypothetical protein MUQ00_13555 [Candidatus Aminicenantes bacterium]|nr:hypothetical protein [Candidatus Aminicenantes bacterium]